MRPPSLTPLPASEESARIRAIFRARAVALASEPAAKLAAGPGVMSLVFLIGPDRYAVELPALAEVLSHPGCTTVPGARPEFAGVMNLRGELRPVVSLARLLGHEVTEPAEFVLMTHRGMGFEVGRVEGLLEIYREELTRPVEGRFYQGLSAAHVMVLDMEALLSGAAAQKEYGS